MKKIIIIIICLIPVFVHAQTDSIASGMYSWKTPINQNGGMILSARIFEGSTLDMESLEMGAHELASSKNKLSLRVPFFTEELLIVKSGTIQIGMKDSTWTIGAESIVLLMPGQKCSMQKIDTGEAASYYLMKYRSKLPADTIRGQNAGGSFVKDWNRIEFKPHDKGGIRNYFERPTAMCKRFEMHF
jgi:(S)-ureidoglycine aminohydrolase